jgi:hypothetical protein
MNLVEIEDCKLKVLLEKYQKTSEEKYKKKILRSFIKSINL